MNIKIHKGFWTRDEVARDVDSVYVFGDNIADNINKNVPKSTQAVIRGLLNSVGIPTKHNRWGNENSFFQDSDFNLFRNILETVIIILKNYQSKGKTICFPSDGIGTGKAMLKEKAPKCWEYLCTRLKEEFDYDNGQNKVNS